MLRKNMIKNKLAESDPMKFLISALIILIVAFIIIYLYNNWFGSAKDTGDNLIDMTKLDCDKDNIPYALDDCVQDIDTSIKGCDKVSTKGDTGCK